LKMHLNSIFTSTSLCQSGLCVSCLAITPENGDTVFLSTCKSTWHNNQASMHTSCFCHVIHVLHPLAFLIWLT
jgi:hypothetical protein